MAQNKSITKKLSYGEKVALLYGKDAWTIRGNSRVHRPSIRVADGPSGLRKVNDLSLGSPASPATAYPCPALLACSFDTDLLTEIGSTLGREARANGVNGILGPGINIKRNPLCGRNFEYYSEDPYLAGTLGSSFVKGVQSVGVAACLKHFACNSQETFRMVNDSIVDERALHEIYLKPFQIAVEESSPWMVMAAYNKVNGTYACENKELLLDTLKGKWKYDGVVISDWGGVNDPILCHRNGLDVEMPCFRPRRTELLYAVRLDRDFAKCVNDSALRILNLSARVNDTKIRPAPFDMTEAHKLAIKAAERSCVLAKNDGLLPLKNLKDVAIIGELASVPSLGGGGSSQVTPAHPVSFLDACRRANPNVDISYSRGYALEGDEDEVTLILDAVDLASRSKKAILFLGTTKSDETEGFDRKNLLLSHAQLMLVERVAEVCDDIVVVLSTGAPVELPFLPKIKSLLISYFSGEGGGEAIYNLLLGIAIPSGHLAETWVARNYVLPSFGIYPGNQTQSLYRESIYVGYRYFCTTGELDAMTFPFGHGLSYARFRYSNLKATVPNKDETKVLVNVTVTNLSAFPADALVQVYVRPVGGKVFKALRTLQAFRRVSLEANEKKDLTIELDRRAFEHYDVEDHDFRVERGTYSIEIGESCREIRLRSEVTLLGDREFSSSIDRLHVYYQPPHDGFWQYDDAFEALLGRVVPISKDPRVRPYTMNSTLLDIQSTAIGRFIFKQSTKILKDDPVMIRMALECPLRNFRMAKIRDKHIQSIVDLANGSIIMAVVHLFIRKRKQ